MKKIIILGGGSAGFLAAIALKTKIPSLDVLVIRSREIGIIGVGEGSTPVLTSFLHTYLNVPERQFFSVARPTFKLGLRFVWGPRPYFNYTFGPTLDRRTDEHLPQPDGFYAENELENSDLLSAMMTADRAFERTAAGPRLHPAIAYHFENVSFVRFLESHAAAVGVRLLEETVSEVRRDETGITSLELSSGVSESADLYVDCSGFASVLLGKALAEPFISFQSSLFCDRAVVGGWERTRELIKPYTTCDTMDAGWSWQIEHENRINRGYVYSSAFMSDEEAEREFRSKNPKVGSTRVVHFRSGRFARNWVKNVVAIGNAAGFVEPLEASALGLIALQTADLTQTLVESDLNPRPTQVACNNRGHAYKWDSLRRFLAVHYKFNTRLSTPFWTACREKTDLAGAEPFVDYYRENGPCSYWAPVVPELNPFGYGGFFTLLMGQCVPFYRERQPTEREMAIWKSKRQSFQKIAAGAMTVKESLEAIHSNSWQWPRK